MLSLLLTILCCAGAVKSVIDEEYEKYSYDDITINGKEQEESVSAWKTTSSLPTDKSNIIKGSNAYVSVDSVQAKTTVTPVLGSATITVTYNLGAPPAMKTISQSNGDKFYEANKADIARLESEMKTSIHTIYDDHKIFTKFPHLKGLARNREFEKMMAMQKVR